MIIDFKEYYHSRNHAGMGYDSIKDCPMCQTMGSSPEAEKEPLITGRDIAKYLIMTTIATLFTELVIRRYLLSSKK